MARKRIAKRRDDLVGHRRIKGNAKAIKEYRNELLKQQGGICPLCSTEIAESNAVLDHCHSSGFIRGVLHRGCNALLGKIENNYKRVGVSLDMLFNISPVIARFLQKDYSSNPFHPNHRTAEEKRLHRNALAQEKRLMKNKSREKLKNQ